jgi:quinol monooxygenase YgiN
LRVTRARIDPERRDEVDAYWGETGRPMMCSAPGCLRADAYWSGEGDELLLISEWTSHENAERFLAGPGHRTFAAVMESLGSTVHERIVGDRID